MKLLRLIGLLLITQSAYLQDSQWSEAAKLEVLDEIMTGMPSVGYDMVAIEKTEVIKYLDSKPYPGYEYLKAAKISFIIYDSETLKIKSKLKIKINEYLGDKEHYMGMTFIDNRAQVIVSKKNQDSRLELYTRDLFTKHPFVGDKNKTIGVIDKYKLLANILDYNLYTTESPNEKINGYYSFYKNPDNKGLKHRVCINDEVAQSWQTFEYETPGSRNFYPSYFEVGNSGHFAVVGYDSQTIGKFAPKKMTVIYKFKGEEFKTHELDLEDHHLISSSIISTDHDELILFGHYTTKLGRGVNGWFIQSITPSKVGEVKYHRYEDEFIMELWNEKSKAWERKNQATDPYYNKTTSPSVYSCEDKSKMIAFGVTQDKDLVDLEYTQEKYKNVRDHMVIMKLNEAGDIEWKKNIFTNRRELNTREMMQGVGRSIRTFFYNEKVYLLFNENYKEDEEFEYKTRLISVNQAGEVKEEFHELKDKSDHIIRPGYCHYFYNDFLFGYKSNKKEQKIGFIELEE